MVAIKKRRISWAVGILAMGCWLGAVGCKPPGPRALLKGEQLVRAGKYSQAVEQLQAAIKLLPTNAQAFNYLGLAYHGNNQPEQAQRFYRNALALDHNLSATHYNLGCLHLEQGNLTAAIDELTSYTLVTPGSVEGWLRLGSAHLRAQHLDAAEKSFKSVLTASARNPDALNGLGLVQVARRRPLDALSYFNSALQQQANHEGALLNVAILAHQHLNNRGLALQKYREYLDLEPRPADWGEVKAIALKLETQARADINSSRSNAPGAVFTRTNLPAIAGTEGPVAPHDTVRSNPVPRVAVPPVAPTNNIADRTPTTIVARAEISRSKPTNSAAIRGELPTTVITNPPSVKSPRDMAANRVPPAAAPGRVTPLDRPPLTAPTKPLRQPQWRYADPGGGTSPSEAAVPTRAAPVSRYGYLSPQPGRPGNRAAAKRFFDEGLRAQRGRRFQEAILGYRKATRADPSYFEAYYNLGLAAFQAQNWAEALTAYEQALAIKPDSTDTRYNFALALKSANYPMDAVNELSALLRARPKDTRLHLTLANTHAQLGQMSQAREHYARVLQLDPRHPDASWIRNWLATH